MFHFCFVCKYNFNLLFQHCAFDGCLQDLKNAWGSSFCEFHILAFVGKCYVCNCRANAVQGTKACQQHALEWQHHQKQRIQSSYNGVQQMLRHPNEDYEWQQQASSSNHPHEELQLLVVHKNFFSPA